MYAKQTKGSSIEGDVAAAKDQLNLVLSFFPRIDAKYPIVLGIDLGMLGVLAAKIPPDIAAVSMSTWYVVAGFVIALGLSLLQLFRGSFPNVDGGQDSIVFFGHIAKLREQKFIETFAALSEPALATELLGQTWRNAKILSQKIAALKRAYVFMIVAAVPWTVALARIAMAAGFSPSK